MSAAVFPWCRRAVDLSHLVKRIVIDALIIVAVSAVMVAMTCMSLIGTRGRS